MMKKGLRRVVSLLIICALISGGALIGSIEPSIKMIYGIITVVAVGSLGLIWLGYNGRDEKKQ